MKPLFCADWIVLLLREPLFDALAAHVLAVFSLTYTAYMVLTILNPLILKDTALFSEETILSSLRSACCNIRVLCKYELLLLIPLIVLF